MVVGSETVARRAYGFGSIERVIFKRDFCQRLVGNGHETERGTAAIEHRKSLSAAHALDDARQRGS